ncbi:CD109 antigen-like [Anopheles albimanus]|uniref:CD109 antigen-like n=1 Tax=Anopheles albimanus TaxID=7167 RepID=UPI00163EE324|nr:CD109 antigen-like [Anopheles albimanus]
MKMWFLVKQSAYIVLMCIHLGEAIFILAPNSIRPNRDYTIVVSNTHTKVSSGTLLIHIERNNSDGLGLLNLKKIVNVKPDRNEMITFKVPNHITDGEYYVTIEGILGFNISTKKNLEFRGSSLSGLIQLSKPVCMPGDKLQFRVIVVNVDLKPPLPHEAMVSVYVQDPDRNVIHEWSNVSLYSGVFENQIAISTIPLAGTYIIEVTVNGKYLVSNSFQVTVDDLNSIDLNIYPTIVPLREHQALNLTIDIKNIFGKSVSGRVKIDLFLEEDELDSSWNDDVNGLRQVYLRFARYLDISGPEHDVTIVGTFTAPSTITSTNMNPQKRNSKYMMSRIYRSNYQEATYYRVQLPIQSKTR